MARKWTLALILICLPFLATVITAFRVRDLPKTLQDSVNKQKCDDCDVSNKHSDKESDRNTHDELKNAARQKQQLINQKVSQKSPHNYDVRSDESKDDDKINIFGVKTKFIQENIGVSKVKTEGSKKFLSFGSNDDDDDDDDDDNDNGDDDGVISNIKKMFMKSDNKPKQDVSSKVKSFVSEDKSDENDSDDDDDDEGEDDDIFVFKKSKIMDLLKTQPGAKSFDVKEPESKFKSSKHVDKHDGDDDDDIKDKTSTIQHTNKVVDVKKSPLKLKPDLKSSIVKQPIPKTKPLKDHDDDHDDNDYDIGKSKTKPHIEPLPKIESKAKVEVKPKPVIQELKKVETKPVTKNDNDVEDDDEDVLTSVDDDDDDDSFVAKAQPKTVTKVQKTESLKKVSIDKKETSRQSSPNDDEKFKIDKKHEKSVKLAESKKVETIKDKKLEDSLTKKGEQKLEKAVKKDKPGAVNKLIPAKEEKQTQKDTKKDAKPNKEKSKKERENDTEKLKSSAEKEKKSKSHEELKEVEKKFTYEPKKIEDLRDGFKPYNFKKDTKTEPDKKRSDDKKIDKSSKEKLFDSQEMFSTTESHLKHVTDALQRRNLLKSEFEDFYAFFPTFAPNFSRIQNPECRRHGQIVLRQLRGTKLWALNMLDATAKIPSGILRGNGIQLGDFDQCLESRARVQLESGSVVKVQGQYCLVRFEVKAEHPELEAPVYLAQAKNLIRSRIDDPGHFLPRFSTLSWGVCVPAACSPEDVEGIVKDAIKHYQHISGVALRVKVDEQDCQVEDGSEWWKDWVEWPTVLTLSFYGVIILLVLVATVQDSFARRTEGQGEEADEKAECDQKESKDNEKEALSKGSDGFLSAFSLYHSVSKLVAPGDTEEISCIHGIRAIATIALLVAHKVLPIAVMPYTNRLKITEVVSSPIWLWCRAGWMFTDCFLLLSGTLTAHKISSESDTGAPRRLFSKYLRLTPALLAVVLFYAYVWDNISSGPMWGTFVTKNAQVCKEGWWWNVLYVQNYFGFEDMCAPQTHQLALDMQLTILGGMLLWVMQARTVFTKILLPGLHFIATYSRYTTVRDHRLTMLAYHGVSGSQLYRTARLSYTSTLHRSTPYLVGLSLGLALKTTGNHSKILLALGWLSSGALWYLVWWAGIDSGSTQYRYSATFAAQYAALAPLASALAIAWMIYALHSGSCNFLSRFLCCRPLVLISRLSYAIYLCQFIVYITNVSTVRTSSEFTLMSMIDVKEISAIFLLSTILTVTLVIPMQSLHKVFTFSSKPTTEDKEKIQNQKQDNHVPEKEEVKEVPTRRHLIAHREILEEIPEAELEYESQRENDYLGEILEEEEDEEIDEESQMPMDNDLEIIEEEGEEEWTEREEYTPRRSYSNEEDQDLDEWEWTANGSRDGAQLFRYSR